jgi:hypothetical protein
MKTRKNKMNDQSEYDNITTVNLGGYGAAQATYTIGSGTDTITLDSSMINTGTLTSPYTITTGGTTVPYTYTTTGTGYNWAQSPTTVYIDGAGLTMKEGADIKIGGKSLTEAIEKIEERLGILKPNPDLEDRWEQLKELRKQYVELEKDLLEKEKLMKILKEK